MGDRNAAGLGGRIILVLLTLYALAMIAPDVLRVVRPLGSFGMNADGDGLVYDVQGPFATEEDSPAWRAGLRRGDRLDLAAMRCVPVDTNVCASLLSLWAGVNYVMPGREATLAHRRDRRASGARSRIGCGAAPHQSPARARGRFSTRSPGSWSCLARPGWYGRVRAP